MGEEGGLVAGRGGSGGGGGAGAFGAGALGGGTLRAGTLRTRSLRAGARRRSGGGGRRGRGVGRRTGGRRRRGRGRLGSGRRGSSSRRGLGSSAGAAIDLRGGTLAGTDGREERVRAAVVRADVEVDLAAVLVGASGLDVELISAGGERRAEGGEGHIQECHTIPHCPALDKGC